VPNFNPPDGLTDLHRELLAIRNDPEVRSLARRRAGALDLAEDALQDAYCAVAGVKNPERIKDLRAYYCRVLINKVYDLRGQLGATLVEDFETLVETRPYRVGSSSARPRPFDEVVLADTCLERFAAQRDNLRAAVAERSTDPDRYRDVIVTVAEQVLRAILDGDVSQADTNDALRAAYPEWFGEKGRANNNAHQRFSRARADVRDLLKAVVNRDELQ